MNMFADDSAFSSTSDGMYYRTSAGSILTVPIPQTDWKPAPKYSHSQQLISSGSKDFVPASELRALDSYSLLSKCSSQQKDGYQHMNMFADDSTLPFRRRQTACTIAPPLAQF